PVVTRLFFPKGTKVLSHGPRFFSTVFLDERGSSRTDNETVLVYVWTLRTQSTFAVWCADNYVKLLSPFDPTNSGLDQLPSGSRHHWFAYGFDYFSKPQQLFTYSFSGRAGGYYADGSRLNFTSELGYRFQPFVSLLVNSTYNYINLPEPWGQRTFWLIGPRLDVTMTNRLFFTAFVQYNEQVKNVNLNTRLQWRYQPASDLFIVYTDNYFADSFHVKNRALVIKWTYWWNI
ncbi:MAG TPA: hydrolase, partial [Chryseosolibacter sp.]|nr:hydrolase [Chryseosolibacter sp.]